MTVLTSSILTNILPSKGIKIQLLGTTNMGQGEDHAFTTLKP